MGRGLKGGLGPKALLGRIRAQPDLEDLIYWGVERGSHEIGEVFTDSWSA